MQCGVEMMCRKEVDPIGARISLNSSILVRV